MESVKSGFKKCPSCNSFQDIEQKKCPNCNFDVTNVPEETKAFPVKWLKFYTYFRIPLFILISFVFLIFTIVYFRVPFISGILSIIFTIFIIMGIFLFIGLHLRKLWGWKLNWYFLSIEILFGVFSKFEGKAQFIGLLLGGILIWFIPNYIYFFKRKSLFS